MGRRDGAEGRAAAAPDDLSALVERILARDESALAALYEVTSPWVYGLVLRILCDRQEAEEATLDAYLQVWLKAATYSRERGTVRAWLASIAHSRALDALRSRAARDQRDSRLADLLKQRRQTSPSPEAAQSDCERRERVARALDRIPREQRRALELAYFEGMTHQEIAGSLGLPLGTVKTQIRLGVLRLRRLLSPSLLNEP
jgi:RNA polymerase sigma-70 factor (ECF subfamily)